MTPRPTSHAPDEHPDRTRPLPVFLTAAEVADRLRVNVREVHVWCKTGILRATKPRKSWLITPEHLQAFIDAGWNTTSDEDVA